MSTGLDRATQDLRELVLAGHFPTDIKLAEETVARSLGVSRTLARLAMGALEREGLLQRQPRRGSRVRAFTIDEVADAIEVRGEMEAMAARILAERGLTAAHEHRLEAIIGRAAAMLAKEPLEAEDRLGWTEANLDFHRTLVELAGNAALTASYEQLILLPLVSPKAIVFNRSARDFGREQVRRADEDHLRVLEAIRARRGQRAAEIMRDHAIRSGSNKRRNLLEMSADEVLVGAAGLALVRSAADGEQRAGRARSLRGERAEAAPR